MNFKKIIVIALTFTSLGAVTAMANTENSRLSQSSNGWKSSQFFSGAHSGGLDAGFSKCNLNADHSSTVGKSYTNSHTIGEAKSSSVVSTVYLQSAVKVNGATSMGYVGNKSSYVKSPTIKGNHTVYEGHNGYIK
ncbi:hypothetical protein [Clostridium mediterraneense]|uniref:hypothetical protein n=1 Tax=Clostridium mediterraneense TaxID=1805472 RepID=UPI00082D99CB|nr:hypothetical protein [Clostridium mediterraneense]